MNCSFETFAVDAKNYFLQAGNIVAQGATGILGGHTINFINLWLHPGKVIIGKPPIPLIDPLQAGICSLTFAAVDFFAKKIFEKYLGEDFANRPLMQAIRMAASISLSALVSSACLHISFALAAAAIGTSILATAIITGVILYYHAGVHPRPVYS